MLFHHPKISRDVWVGFPNLLYVKCSTQGAYESIRTRILEPRGTEPERNHLEIDPRRNWIGVWVRNEPAMFFLPLFGVGLRPTSRFNPPSDTFHLWTQFFRGWTQTRGSTPHSLMAFISEHNFSGLNSDPRFNPPLTDGFHLWAQLFGVELRPEVQPFTDGFHLWTLLFGVELRPTSRFNPPLVPFMSEHNFSGLNSDPRFNPPLMAFISQPYFSGLNWDPHPGSTPHWYLSSLSTTFRGWTQTRGSTWWLSSLNSLFGVELGPTSWFNPPLIPFISEHNFSGLNSDPRFNPPLMALISEPHFLGLNPCP